MYMLINLHLYLSGRLHVCKEAFSFRKTTGVFIGVVSLILQRQWIKKNPFIHTSENSLLERFLLLFCSPCQWLHLEFPGMRAYLGSVKLSVDLMSCDWGPMHPFLVDYGRVWMALGLCHLFGEVCALVYSHRPPAADLGVPGKSSCSIWCHPVLALSLKASWALTTSNLQLIENSPKCCLQVPTSSSSFLSLQAYVSFPSLCSVTLLQSFMCVVSSSHGTLAHTVFLPTTLMSHSLCLCLLNLCAIPQCSYGVLSNYHECFLGGSCYSCRYLCTHWLQSVHEICSWVIDQV